MKVGTLSFDDAVKKLHDTHSIMCDQLGEFVSLVVREDLIEIYAQGSDLVYDFIKSQNETVQVCVATNGASSFQYMRMYTEDGDEMDFVLFEPAPILTLDDILYPA